MVHQPEKVPYRAPDWLLRRFEEDGPQRRQCDVDRAPAAVPADWPRLHAAEVALPAPAELRGVAVIDLAPEARRRDAHAVLAADHRGEVQGHDDDVAFALAAPHEREHAVFRVTPVDPLEPAGLGVAPVHRGLGLVDAVERPDEARQLAVHG